MTETNYRAERSYFGHNVDLLFFAFPKQIIPMNHCPSLYGAIFCLVTLPMAACCASAQEATQTTYRVVSYNIKHCRGNDDKVDLPRTASVLKQLKPDFVGLQEVDQNAKRSGKVDQVALLGKQLGMQPAFGSFMDFQGGRYGMGILSKHPIESIRSVKLPTGNEPRVALAVQVKLPTGASMMLVNVHFDWVSDDKYRFEQAKTLRTYLDALTIPYILLGDFNDQPESRTVKLLGKGAIEAAKPRDDRFTFSSDNPKTEIDFIFAAPDSHWTVEKVDVIDEPLASDHRPVLTELSLRHSP